MTSRQMANSGSIGIGAVRFPVAFVVNNTHIFDDPEILDAHIDVGMEEEIQNAEGVIFHTEREAGHPLRFSSFFYFLQTRTSYCNGNALTDFQYSYPGFGFPSLSNKLI